MQNFDYNQEPEILDPAQRIYVAGGCLAGEELIWTPSGMIEIKDIKKGQKVYCFNPQGNIEVGVVEETFIHYNTETFLYQFWGGDVRATPNHAFYTENGSFKEIGKWVIDEFFIDYRGEYRPLLKVSERSQITTYNFTVAPWHTYIVGKHGILSSNGGGGKKSGSPTEQADTARSTSRANVVEILSEGPIEGFITEDDQSIYLDKTPVGNADGSKNFEGFTYEFREGTQNQSILADTIEEGLTSETSVNADVQQALPVTRTFINAQITAVRVRLGFQMQTYEEDGDITGNDLHFRIYIRQGSVGAFNLVYEENKQNQKFSSLTEFEYQFALDNQNGNVDEFSIRVERVTADSESSSEISVLKWQSFTEIVATKLNYSNTAVVALEFLADQFSAVPQRGYEIGGRTVLIPINAVVNETDRGLDFNGDPWDGTFYEPCIATRDPAWQLFDILINERYGLGKQLKRSQISAYDLYAISQYNNEFVDDGFGGTERRFQCSTVLQRRSPAHEVIGNFLNSCRAYHYWDGTCIRFWQDKPANAIRQFTNADVENGDFKYSSTDIQTRNSVANVTWNDPDDFYRTTIESVELREALDKYGWRDTDFTAYGCISRGQAYRAGRHSLYSGYYLTESVSFKARTMAIYCRPGDVFTIADWKRANIRYGGLVETATTTSVTLDQEINLPNATGYTITCTMPDMSLESKTVTNGSGDHQTITISGSFSTAPVNGANWVISVVQARSYRCRTLKVENDNPNLVEVIGTEYRADLYDNIETGFALEPRIKDPEPPAVPPLPEDVTVSFTQLTTASNEDYQLNARWKSPSEGGTFVAGYNVQYRRGLGGDWSPSFTTQSREFTFSPVTSGTYYVRVASIMLNGSESNWATSPASIAGSEVNLYYNFTRKESAIAL